MRNQNIRRISTEFLSKITLDLIPIKVPSSLYFRSDNNSIYLGEIVSGEDQGKDHYLSVIGDDYSRTLMIRNSYLELEYLFNSRDRMWSIVGSAKITDDQATQHKGYFNMGLTFSCIGAVKEIA